MPTCMVVRKCILYSLIIIICGYMEYVFIFNHYW